jgi:hypothetical protein
MDLQIDCDAEREKVEEQTINPTAYFESFVEHFPESKHQEY